MGFKLLGDCLLMAILLLSGLAIKKRANLLSMRSKHMGLNLREMSAIINLILQYSNQCRGLHLLSGKGVEK